MKLPILIVMLGAVSACGGSGGGGPTVAQPLAVSPATPVSGTPGSPGSSAPPPAPNTLPGPPGGVDNVTFEGLLNNVRLANSAAPVAFDSRLGSAAQKHAGDMLANGYFSHTGLNGSSPGDRITAEGYQWRAYGENIAQGQTSQAQVLNAWTNSPGHHANNINPNFEDFGLGKAGSGSSTRWVLVLASER
ncbi:MAG: CAP domain-containing protein [Pseudomonadota bacterium]